MNVERVQETSHWRNECELFVGFVLSFFDEWVWDTWLTWDKRVIYLRIGKEVGVNSDKDWWQSFICEAKKCQLGLRKPS